MMSTFGELLWVYSASQTGLRASGYSAHRL